MESGRHDPSGRAASQLCHNASWPAITREGGNLLRNSTPKEFNAADLEEAGTFAKQAPWCVSCGTYNTKRHRREYHSEGKNGPGLVAVLNEEDQPRVCLNINERILEPEFNLRLKGPIHENLLMKDRDKIVCIVYREVATVEHVCSSVQCRRMAVPSMYTTKLGLSPPLSHQYIVGVPVPQKLGSKFVQFESDQGIYYAVCTLCKTRVEPDHCQSAGHKARCERDRKLSKSMSVHCHDDEIDVVSMEA